MERYLNYLAEGVIALANKMLEDRDIIVKACDWCGQPFYQGRENHRFCCIECGRKFHIAERRAAVALFRATMRMQEMEEDEQRPISRLAG
jgi:uncharacterized Zn finger protein (UPF0148 family)